MVVLVEQTRAQNALFFLFGVFMLRSGEASADEDFTGFFTIW